MLESLVFAALIMGALYLIASLLPLPPQTKLGAKLLCLVIFVVWSCGIAGVIPIGGRVS